MSNSWDIKPCVDKWGKEKYCLEKKESDFCKRIYHSVQRYYKKVWRTAKNLSISCCIVSNHILIRTVHQIPKCLCNGSQQWWPERTQIPCSENPSAISLTCFHGNTNDQTPRELSFFEWKTCNHVFSRFSKEASMCVMSSR